MGTLMKNGIPYGGVGGESVEIVDNLESTDPNKALSANMGRELNDKVMQSIFVKSFDSATGTLETVSADNIG